ncbi:GNAT family N-acetyltransferase [Streptococcus moroccensis]|uniref:Ribosomal protein S18 acetylase RimI-like enzyme n=1 Tax=Streptococcus moroccensis TaxID=1451356 RepID=A0ABT9YQE1_9STRE|nr:GNAT family N-acetyltransferase [Streptococcus moroccensis]MDQ0221811.1 ribosomal protein S18 acetylase RimI-like enzyme [Streptococcus moroccensis]
MIIRHIKEQDLDTIYQLYSQEGWKTYTTEMIESLVNNSYWKIVEDNGEVCGFARYITDHVLSIYLCEIVVAQNRRRQGVGQMLIEAIFQSHPGLRMDLSSFEDGFYEQLEFRAIGTAYRKYGKG